LIGFDWRHFGYRAQQLGQDHTANNKTQETQQTANEDVLQMAATARDLGSGARGLSLPEQADGYAVYTNMVPGAGFRGYAPLKPSSRSKIWGKSSGSIRSSCAAAI